MIAQLEPARRGGRRWPWILAGLIATQASLMIGMVYIATSDPSAAAEPDYYRKALAWNEHAAERDASAALGWSAAWAVRGAGQEGDRGVVLSLRLATSEGGALDGGEAEAVAFHQARAKDRRGVKLAAVGGGVYEGRLEEPRPGLWEVRVRVRRGPDVFVRTDTVEVPAPGAR